MIIQSQTFGSSIKTRLASQDSLQSSESDSSYEGFNQMTYYISSVETTPDNHLVGEEVVMMKSEDATVETNSLRSETTDDYGSSAINREVQLAVMCLQGQGSMQNSNIGSPIINNIDGVFNGVSHKRKLCSSEEIAMKRRRLGDDNKITVVYPVKTNIRTPSGQVNQSVITNNNNGKATYKCPICDKTFETDKYLSMHLSLHKYRENPKQTFESSKQQPQQHVTSCGEFRTKVSKKQDNSMIMTPTDGRQAHASMSSAMVVNSPPSTNSSINGQWTCPYCQKTFVQNSNFKNHVRTHSDERPFVCDICSIGFKERYHLKKHVLFKHTNDLKETCRVCGKCFKDSTAVRAHERIHSEVRPYGCTLCGKTFKTSECLWHHENRSKTCGKAILAKQQQNNNIAGPTAHLNFSQAGNIISSVQVHKKQRKSKLSVSLEAKTHMNNSEPLNISEQLDNALMDSVCIDESFIEGIWAQLNEVENSQSLEQAVIKAASDVSSTIDSGVNSTELRPYKCKLCDNAFKLKVHLKKHHLYRHTNEYPCECSICGKRFKDTSAVRLHERIHSSERPFKCTCGKSFKTRENLWGHKNRGPCDLRMVCQSGTVADCLTNANVTRGKTKILKPHEIGVQIDNLYSNGNQNHDNFMRVKLLNGDNQVMNHQVNQNLSASSLTLSRSSTHPEITLTNTSNAGLTSLKLIKTRQQESGSVQPLLNSGGIETSLSYHSNLTIPTAVVAPICRPQSILKNGMSGTLCQDQFTSKNIPAFSKEARKCPTIHSLLLSKGNKVAPSSKVAMPGNTLMNSIKEPRVLKLYNAPTDTLAILIPTDSSQQFSIFDLNATIRDTAVQEQRIPTLNTLMVNDFVPNAVGINQNVQTYLNDNELGNIFDFQVGDLQDSAFMNFKDAPNVGLSCGSMASTLEDLVQTVDVQSSSLDEMCMSGWSSDSSWFLGDDVSFLDDVPEVVPTVFSQ